MQAIILAAGMGKRLGELTKENTKCMVKVNGVALIDRLLTQLAGLNLSRVVIVVGYKADNLMEYIGDRYSESLNIEYILNPIYDKTNNIYSLALAKDKLREEDTLLVESDLILDDSLFSLLMDDPYPDLALVAEYRSWMDGTMVRIDDECNIVNFIPKSAFKYSDVAYYYKTVNLYKFSRDFLVHKYIPFLEAYCSALGNNEYYEQVLRVMCMLDNFELKALPVGNERWYEIDDIHDLNVAEAMFADSEERLKSYMKRYGGYWRFPDMLDYCYLVNPYFPSERLNDEMRANFDVLLTGYPSGLAVNSLLAGKCFGVRKEYIVPGNGAAELIRSLMNNLSGKVGVIYPTFEEYPNRLEPDMLEVFVPQTDDFHYSVQDVIDFYSVHQVNSLLLINPDNPSGNYLPFKDVVGLAEWCADNDIRLVLDESFVDFSSEFPHNSMLSDDMLERFPNMVVLKSISKSFGVPGLRLGVLATADDSLLHSIRKDISIWNINSFAEFFMQIFSKYHSDYIRSAEKFQSERRLFRSELESIPYLQVFDSEANYFLCKVNPPFTSHGLAVRLLNEFQILIKDCSSKKVFEGRNYIRLAVRGREDNKKLIAALKVLQ